MGRADGSIIATIMTVSRTRKTASAAGSEMVISVIMSSLISSVEDHVTYQAAATARATVTATAAVSCRSGFAARTASVFTSAPETGDRYEDEPRVAAAAPRGLTRDAVPDPRRSGRTNSLLLAGEGSLADVSRGWRCSPETVPILLFLRFRH